MSRRFRCNTATKEFFIYRAWAFQPLKDPDSGRVIQFADTFEFAMSIVNAHEMDHDFSALGAGAMAREVLAVKLHRRSLPRTTTAYTDGTSQQERKALVHKALSIRMTQPLGSQFERSDAYAI